MKLNLKLPLISDDLFPSTRPLAFFALACVAIIITIILSSRYYFFQNIIENGVSKKQIVAKKTIEVVDVKKTELLKKDVAGKIRPVMTPVEDNYIRSSLVVFFNTVERIRTSAAPYNPKFNELLNYTDIIDQKKDRYTISYLLNSSEANLELLEQNTILALKEILKTNITDSNFQDGTIEDTISHGEYSNIPRSQIKAIAGILEHIIAPNLMIDEEATEMAKKNARALVKPYTVTFEKDDVILRAGEPVTQLKLDALKKSGYAAMELNKGGVAGIFLLVSLAIIFLLVYIKKYEKKFLKPNYMALLSIFAIILSYLTVVTSAHVGVSNYFMPIPVFAILVAIFMSPIVAFLSTILLLTLFSITLSLDHQLVAVFIFTTLTCCYAVSKICYTRRFDLILCGIEAGCMAFLTITLIALFEGQTWSNFSFAPNAAAGFLNCLLSSIVALGILPMAEYLFKIVTPYGLIELADHNQPLLSKLQFKAPGTYHHSLMVANLCEAAAEAIGADPILARVGAFYHDIGKLKRPLFFIENQSYFGIENPHTKLNPRLSKMVITSHTKDGVELAKESGLPEVITNFIQQHHGEGLAGHFYSRAVEQEGAENVDEEQFRYIGPKPSTKETAILMLADAVESAVRSLKNPDQEEIENMINKIITERLNDDQLSDSPLTLKDIKLVAKTFNRILRGMQHDRIKYHENILSELEKNKIRLSETPEDKLDKKIRKKQLKHEQQNG